MRLLVFSLLIASASLMAQPVTDSPKRVVIRASNEFVSVGEYGACTFDQVSEILKGKYPKLGVEVRVAANVQRSFVEDLLKSLRAAQIADVVVSPKPLESSYTLWAPGSQPGKCGAAKFS